MNELTVVKKEIFSEPERVGALLRETALSLSVNKQKIEGIKKQNPIKGLFSYKALAEALLEQNQSISAFMSILQSVLLLQANNVAGLSIVMESLSEAEATDNENESEYVEIAKECLAEALATAKKNCENERRLVGVQKELDLAAEQMKVTRNLLENLQKESKKQEKRLKFLLGVCVAMGALCAAATILMIVL